MEDRGDEPGLRWHFFHKVTQEPPGQHHICIKEKDKRILGPFRTNIPLVTDVTFCRQHGKVFNVASEFAGSDSRPILRPAIDDDYLELPSIILLSYRTKQPGKVTTLVQRRNDDAEIKGGGSHNLELGTKDVFSESLQLLAGRPAARDNIQLAIVV